MNPLALFCKSYRPDLERCAALVDSLRRHNRAGLPVYLSVPAADRPLFVDRLGRDAPDIVTDEEVMGGAVSQSWISQQLVKLRFARTGLAATYFWIDSDFVVIRDFDESDFLARSDVPFTVMGEARRDLFRDRLLGGLDAERDPEQARMYLGLLASLAAVRDVFKRRGPPFFFGPPVIWSCRVVHALEAWLRERRMTFESMLAIAPYESAWYGEFLLAHQVIPVIPRGGLAFPFTRDDEWERFAAAGLTLEELAGHGYLAVNYAAKWMKHVATPVAPAAPAREAARARGLDLSAQWHGSYHRAGWGYALRALEPLHHPSGIHVEGFVEKKFAWGRDPGDRRNDFRPCDRPWIGFWHNPPGIPEWFNGDRQAPADVLADPGWRESLPSCRGLFALSEANARWLRPHVGVPVYALKHPAAPPIAHFSLDAYRRNPSKAIAQVGYWLRRFASLHELPVRRLHKVLLNAREPWMTPAIEQELTRVSPARRSGVVTALPYQDAGAYDRFLSRNLVFLHLHDASANNAIIECIVRHTPVLVNPLDAVVEYLGPDYPLYFDTLEEAAAKAEDDDQIAAAHAYLVALAARGELSAEAFLQSLLGSPIAQALDLAPPRAIPPAHAP